MMMFILGAEGGDEASPNPFKGRHMVYPSHLSFLIEFCGIATTSIDHQHAPRPFA